MGEGLLPSRNADEVGHEEYQRAALDHLVGRAQKFTEVGGVGVGLRLRRALHHRVHDVHDVAAVAAHGNDLVDLAAVEHRADAIAVAREQAREHGDELDRERLLANFLGAEIDRGAQVEQEPRGDLALLVVLAHVRRLQPRGDVPVDVADVVVILVFTQVRQVEPGAAEQRPVVAVEQSVEPADDRPLEPPEDAIRRRRRLGHGFRAVSRAPGCAA